MEDNECHGCRATRESFIDKDVRIMRILLDMHNWLRFFFFFGFLRISHPSEHVGVRLGNAGFYRWRNLGGVGGWGGVYNSFMSCSRTCRVSVKSNRHINLSTRLNSPLSTIRFYSSQSSNMTTDLSFTEQSWTLCISVYGYECVRVCMCVHVSVWACTSV